MRRTIRNLKESRLFYPNKWTRDYEIQKERAWDYAKNHPIRLDSSTEVDFKKQTIKILSDYMMREVTFKFNLGYEMEIENIIPIEDSKLFSDRKPPLIEEKDILDFPPENFNTLQDLIKLTSRHTDSKSLLQDLIYQTPSELLEIIFSIFPSNNIATKCASIIWAAYDNESIPEIRDYLEIFPNALNYNVNWDRVILHLFSLYFVDLHLLQDKIEEINNP